MEIICLYEPSRVNKWTTMNFTFSLITLSFGTDRGKFWLSRFPIQ